VNDFTKAEQITVSVQSPAITNSTSLSEEQRWSCFAPYVGKVSRRSAVLAITTNPIRQKDLAPMADHLYSNEATQAERRQIERDSYLSRAQADADLTSQGRFKRETTTRVTGVPVYPSLPSSSPWAQFDQNVEPALGFSVDEVPAQANLEVVGVEPPLCADDLGGSMAPTDASLSAVETGPPKPKRRQW
jgi:hypothetical protein